MIGLTAGLTSCSKDDDDDELPQMEDPTGSFNLPAEPLNDGMVVVKNLTMSHDGWIVVRRDNGNEEPDFSHIISQPEYVEAGTHSEVLIELKDGINLLQGERLWVNLHNDNGDQEFTYDGSNNIDMPLGYWDLNWGYVYLAHSFIVDLTSE